MEDVDALNAGLNTPTDDTDPYDQVESTEETSAEAQQTEEPEQQEPQEAEQQEEETEEIEDDINKPLNEPEKPVTRAQMRIQNLANEKKLVEQRLALAEQRLQQVEQERLRQQQAQFQQQRFEEEENLSDLEKWQRNADMTIRQVQFNNQDMQDKSEFLLQVSKHPEEAKYIERVEATLAEARRNGFYPRREDVLIRLMGLDRRKEFNESAAKAPGIKREAAQRVNAAKGKPVSVKQTVAPQRQESSEYDRLKDIVL